VADDAYGDLFSDAASFGGDMGWKHGDHEMDLRTMSAKTIDSALYGF
jgi:hypothetical protein